MNFGPRKIVISIAAIPAIRIAPPTAAQTKFLTEEGRDLVAKAELETFLDDVDAGLGQRQHRNAARGAGA